MVRIDGNKLQEVRDHHEMMAQNEIAQAKADADTEELTESDILAIEQKWLFQTDQLIDNIVNTNPEKIFKNGFALDANGWREGYTKPLIKDKTAKRRAKNKLARKSRKIQRRK